MNRSCKIEFHNGYEDEKPIVTFSFVVNNGTRFKALDDTGKEYLIEEINDFIKSLNGFKQEVERSKQTIAQ